MAPAAPASPVVANVGEDDRVFVIQMEAAAVELQSAPTYSRASSMTKVHPNPVASLQSSVSYMSDVKAHLSTADMDRKDSHTVHGSSTPFMTGVNIVNTILGTGMLSLPLAFSQSSIILGIAIVLLVYLITIWAVYYVVAAIEHSGIFTWTGLGKAAFGATGVAVVQILVGLNCLGLLIPYQLIISENVQATVELLLPDPSLYDGWRWVQIICTSLLVLFPLCLLKDLSKLVIPSAIGVLIMIATMGLVIAGLTLQLAEFEWFDLRPALFNAISIMALAFNFMQNVPRLYFELQDRTPRKFVTTTAVAMLVPAFMYIAVGTAGYITIGNVPKFPGMVLSASVYDAWIPAEIDRMLLAVAVAVTFPFVFFAMRETLLSLFHEDTEVSAAKQRTWWIITVAIFVVVTVVPMFVESVAFVSTLVGATCTTWLSFIVPPVLHQKLVRRKCFGASNYALVAVGVVCSLVSLIVLFMG